jgi:5'(3')-deoxyribonucleotidase
MKTIAIDLDDTLNDFTETLQRTEFVRDRTHAISEEVFRDYLARLRSGSAESGGLLSTEFTYFRAKIHQACYELTRARADGVAFLQWLRQSGWRIVICTQRDLRRAQEVTRKWLADNGIPFDVLFMAGNKIVFCKLWGIEYLVDDDEFNITHGRTHGVSVFFPATDRTRSSQAGQPGWPFGARGFERFEEIKPWIQG